ncbi:hypothetical protein Pint_03324 [Pistacia integerrima]|uniref:Uncharacterized protein n=1 Tax=Pistacia integerrima TaxID=434235 RepID=A0ACC0ZHK1_9ROSI|nr:hypothetical protein Pint_03324 [Pistacia integerrima]
MNNSMSFLMMILTLGCGVAMAVEYKVGDEPGWTRKVPVDYYQWVSGKIFYVGDALEDLKNEKDNEESHAPSESPNAPGPSGGLPPYSDAPTYSPSP